MSKQPDATAQRGIIAMAGGTSGFIAPTIVMVIATISMSAGNSAAISRADARTAAAGARPMRIAAGRCERAGGNEASVWSEGQPKRNFSGVCRGLFSTSSVL